MTTTSTTLADVLAAAEHADFAPVPQDAVDDLAGRLIAHTLRSRHYLGEPLYQARLTKRLVTLAGRCGHLAALQPAPLTLTNRAAVGLAVGPLIGRWALTGRALPDDPLRWAATALASVGDDRLAALIDRLPTLATERLTADLTARATALIEPLTAVGDGWQPRTEVRLALNLARDVTVSGRADLVLGGAATRHPAIVIETKVTWHPERHDDELGFYGLLHAVTLGAPAAVVGLDTTGTTRVNTVTVESLEAEAERWAPAIAELVAQAAGDNATRTGGAWCATCPALRGCDTGAEWMTAPVSFSADDDTDTDTEDWHDGI